MTLSERMVLYRAKHNLSQRAFAGKVGLSLQTVNSIETGQQSPSRVTEAKINLLIEEDEKKEIDNGSADADNGETSEPVSD